MFSGETTLRRKIFILCSGYKLFFAVMHIINFMYLGGGETRMESWIYLYPEHGSNRFHRINCNYLPESTAVAGKIVVWNHTVLSTCVWCDIKLNSYSNFCPEDECRIFLRNTWNYLTVYRCRNQQNHSLHLHRCGNPRSYMLNLNARQNYTGLLNALFREEGGSVFLRNIGNVYQTVRILCSSNHTIRVQ